MSKMNKFFIALGEAMVEIDERNKEREEQMKAARENFETENKVYNRGTVIATAAKAKWSSWDIERIVEEVDTPEKAEAVVGLI